MNYPLLISLCFLPLVIIIIITKIYLWMSYSAAEVKYVKKESKLPHGPFLQNVYKDIDEENEKDRDW